LKNKIKSAHFNHADLQKILKSGNSADENEVEGGAFSGGINPTAGVTVVHRAIPPVRTDDIEVDVVVDEEVEMGVADYDNHPSPGQITMGEQNPLARMKNPLTGGAHHSHNHHEPLDTSFGKDDEMDVDVGLTYGAGSSMESPKFSYSR
jgi:hypothetical protein